jgi:hypothetical protein
MRRFLITFVIAVGCAGVLDIQTNAQTSESKTKVKTEHAKTMTYTGCVQTGTQTRTYTLQNVMPISKTETSGTAGTTTTITYALVPEETVELQSHVGHKVEVTGVLIPAGKGDAKIRTRSKAKGSEQETKTEVERGAMPQLKVVSVKQLAESC